MQQANVVFLSCSGLRSSSGSHLDAMSLEESAGQACWIAALRLLVCSHNCFPQQRRLALSVPPEGPVQLLMQAPHPDPHSRNVTAKLIYWLLQSVQIPGADLAAVPSDGGVTPIAADCKVACNWVKGRLLLVAEKLAVGCGRGSNLATLPHERTQQFRACIFRPYGSSHVQ